MGILDSISRSAALSRKQEQVLYELVAEELENGDKVKGLWLKALADSGGDEAKSMAKYVKLRVKSLADDQELLRQALKARQQSETAENSKKSETSGMRTPNKGNVVASQHYEEAEQGPPSGGGVLAALIIFVGGGVAIALFIALQLHSYSY